MRYYFEWDPAKGNVNIQKHKVSFQRTAEVFKDPGAISIFDIEHSHNEDRWITMGRDFREEYLLYPILFMKLIWTHAEFALFHRVGQQRKKQNNMRGDTNEGRI